MVKYKSSLIFKLNGLVNRQLWFISKIQLMNYLFYLEPELPEHQELIFISKFEFNFFICIQG